MSRAGAEPSIDLDGIQNWLMNDALPFWAHHGRDREHGGPIESLALDAGAPSEECFKRVRVTCRQIYVYSHAALLGYPHAEEQSDGFYAYLQSRCTIDENGGWARLLTRDGHVLDPTPDLYDYAFVMFALAWRFRAFGDRRALEAALRTFDRLEADFCAGLANGFHHVLPPVSPRQQNPHMHLTEAMLVWREAGGPEQFSNLGDELITLFKTRILSGRSGILLEEFDENWSPAATPGGRRVEPGHQFEWAWILAEHQRLTGEDHSPTVNALVDWAERYGVDPASQVTFNAVRDDGFPIDTGSRTWPNTERIKGWIAKGFVNEDMNASRASVAGSLQLLFSRYFAPAPRGTWIDAYDTNGTPIATTIPTSTFYHVFLALTEALRAFGRRTDLNLGATPRATS